MIDQRMIKYRVTQRDLAAKMGVTQARISQLLSSRGNLTLKTVDRVLVAIDEAARP